MASLDNQDDLFDRLRLERYDEETQEMKDFFAVARPRTDDAMDAVHKLMGLMEVLTQVNYQAILPGITRQLVKVLAKQAEARKS